MPLLAVAMMRFPMKKTCRLRRINFMPLLRKPVMAKQRRRFCAVAETNCTYAWVRSCGNAVPGGATATHGGLSSAAGLPQMERGARLANGGALAGRSRIGAPTHFCQLKPYKTRPYGFQGARSGVAQGRQALRAACLLCFYAIAAACVGLYTLVVRRPAYRTQTSDLKNRS